MLITTPVEETVLSTSVSPDALVQLPEWLRDVIVGVDSPTQAGTSQNAVSEGRIGRLAGQVAALGEALSR